MTTGPPDWEQLLALFEETLARPPGQRAAFLQDHVSGDEGMRREIESLLAAHEMVDGFLDSPAALAPPAAHVDAGRAVGAGALRLATGTRIGVFEVLEPLGVGGMGEVYRARDTRLDRFVALKVLASHVELAPRSRVRFVREARAISKLSHPHICTVHDVGSAEIEGRELPFLVMELLDGETLAARLTRGRLPIDQSLTFAIDIADAVAAAHRHGIVHRDLKPANVMVTKSGVKLLDFGLAQLRMPGAAGSPDGGDSSFTEAGMVFGTLPYMAPEQLRGEAADVRTDIFALGTLLHEMLTGSRPFAADSQAGLIAAILEHHPTPVSNLRPLASTSVDRIVRKCLAKDPDDRWQSARDLRDELQWTLEEVRNAGPPALRRPAARSLGPRAGWLPAAALAAALIAGLLGWRLATAPLSTPAVTHLSLNFPPGVTLHIPINGTSFAVSPDGSRVAYIGVRGGRESLFVHTLDSSRAVEVPDTRDALNPIFSPDGEWIAFAQASAVRKVPAAGGPVQLVCDCPGRQMTWLADGRIVRGGGLRPIAEVRADERPVTRLAEGEEAHHTPVLMADGSLLFTVVRGGWQSTRNSIAVWPPGGGAAREIIPSATSPQFVADDAVVFAQGRTLVAAGFDSRSLRVVGEPRALDVEVQTTAYSAAPMYALARNGTLVYAEPGPGRRLVWIDRQGREEFLDTEERMYSHLRISPDGTRVATYQADADRDLWVYALDGSSVQKLTNGPARDAMPVWSPDGAHIYFTTAERHISRIAADRSAGAVTLFDVPRPDRIHPLAITPDGQQLLIQWDQLPRRIDQRLLQLGPPPTLTPLVADSGSERDGRLSPDGRWVAYQSDESTEGHEGQIMVRPFPDSHTRRWVISPGLGRQPIWSGDGTEIFYRTEDGTVMAVPVRTTPSFVHGPPVRVVTPLHTLRDWATGPTYDVSPDGRRFLFIKAQELDIRSLTVVLNWDLAVQAALARQD